MKIKNLLVIFAVILALFLTGCKTDSHEQDNQKINVIVSILPQKAFVEAVGKDKVNVKELIPPGGSPESYEPNPGDLALVEKADIYFRIGYIPFEKSHAEKFAGLNPNMEIIDTSANVKLRYFEEEENPSEEGSIEDEHHHEGIDPHIWLSPTQVKKQIDVIAQSLSQKDPQNAGFYKENAENYKSQLDELHAEIQTEFMSLKTDKLMVFHPAWGYFADEFGLEQIAIEESGKEPTAEQLQQLIEKAKEEQIKVIFVQSQFNKEIAESIAEQVGAVIVTIDPLSEDYINNLRNVATTIAESLNG